MIFQHTWEKVLSGEKTQTRRIVKTGDVELIRPSPQDKIFFQHGKTYVAYLATETRAITGIERNGRYLYGVGKVYSVQPERGKYAIYYRYLSDGKLQIWNNHNQGVPCQISLDDEWKSYKQSRIRITDIRREDVRTISDEDVLAEGFKDYDDFMRLWCSIHDKNITLPLIPSRHNPLNKFGAFYRGELADRPAARYDAWALTFEVVK